MGRPFTRGSAYGRTAHRRRAYAFRAAVAAALGALLATLAASAAAAPDPGPLSFRPAPVLTAPGSARPARSHDVTLITGDRVQLQVYADGRQTATVEPASRGAGRQQPRFEIRELDGDVHVIPSDVARYVGDRLDPDLFNVSGLVEQGLDDRSSESLPLIVTYRRAERSLPEGLAKVATLGSIEGVAARQPKANAPRLGRALATGPAALAGVETIWLDRQVAATLAESVPAIGAPVAWASGYDGTGITVAVLDTGIDDTHPDLAGKVVDVRNFSNSPTSTDRHGHGTHVAATIAGSGEASGGARKGVAPGATLLSGKVLRDTGTGQASWIIAGMEWAARDQGADIVNLSVGAGPSDGSDPMSQAVDSLTATHGTLFVVAAGNGGPRDQTIAAPGAASSALTVGAVDATGTPAPFSSRGPRSGDFAVKPDLAAPGVGIVAARAAGTSLGTPVDDLYTRASGTSMATPHVAGAAALLAQRYEDWNADELKGFLIATASPGPHTVYEQGAGRVDVARAFTQAPVLAAPAPLDLGSFSWPHRAHAPVTRTVTYTNHSGSALTLELALTVADETGKHAAPKRMVALSRDSLAVPPGGSATVDVTLDPRVGVTGSYSGYLVAREPGGSAVVGTPLGFHKAPETNPWRLQATLPNTVIKDMSFASPTVGYIAAELGKVYKTTDGGETWELVMDVGFPFYWYGVDAISENDVVVSGFDNSNFRGLLRWSHDGGRTWGPEVVLTTRGWSLRVRFADENHGLVMDLLNFDRPNAAHYTTTGGRTAADWTEVTVDQAGGWFGNQFSLLPNLRARASGITFCDSRDGGAVWSCRPSVDEVFDGPTFFLDDSYGWVGGGSISPTVAGWLHTTTDGGETWSGRTLDARWPIREIRFVTKRRGWAVGGNVFSGVGGIYFSGDGGETWSLDLDSGAEMSACDGWWHGPQKFQLWCAGYTGSFAGKVYTLEPSRGG